METNSTESKKTKVVDANDPKNLISALPNEIIVHILSFLPTRYAVATSILSKRWRYLWTNITNLEFNYYYYPRVSGVSDNARFHNFVDTVIHQCTSPQFHRFRLSTFTVTPDRIQAWIDEAFRRGVYELELNVSKFPSWMPTWNTLTILKLYATGRSNLEIPSSTYFPRLRVFSIEFRCPSEVLTEKLFRSFPALEELNVKATGFGKFLTFFISSPVLKRLTFTSHLREFSDEKLVINAPNLERMDLSEMQMAVYELENLSSIAEANVNVGYMYNRLGDVETRVNRGLELLRGLHGVKSLSIGSFTMRVLSHANLNRLPIYCNLTKLELTIGGVLGGQRDGRRILPCLLQVSPKLKVFVFHMDRTYMSICFLEKLADGYIWIAPQSIPECLSSCLERVQLNMFLGTEYELNMAEYFLVHAGCLKELTINPWSPVAKVALRQKLLKLPRSSQTCEICVSD